MTVTPRPAIQQVRKPHKRSPHLRPVEQTLFVLLSSPGEWFLIDEWDRNLGGNSGPAIALSRRGCEVVRRFEADRIQAFARWEHDVPTCVAPWEAAP